MITHRELSPTLLTAANGICKCCKIHMHHNRKFVSECQNLFQKAIQSLLLKLLRGYKLFKSSQFQRLLHCPITSSEYTFLVNMYCKL